MILKLFLIILLTCVSALNGENKVLKEKKLQKMVAHIPKIRNLEAGTEGDGSSASQEYGSQPSQEFQSQSSQESNSSILKNVTETTTTTPNINISSTPSIEILGFSSFKQEPKKITFITSFYFNNKLPPKIIKFILTIYYESNLQEKSANETSKCLIIGEPAITNEIVNYNCEAPKNDTVGFEQVVVNRGFTLENGDDTMEEGTLPNWEDVHFSEEASAASENLQEQTQVINNILKLENGELITNSTYFIIKGNIDKYNGKVGEDLRLIVYDNLTYPTTPQNVSCKIQTANGSNYEFKCTPTQGVRGTIYLSPIYTEDTYNFKYDKA